MPWNENYLALVESGQLDHRRWRLGADFWTHLDHNLAFSVDGQQFEPGLEYLALERTADGDFLLWWLPPESIREQRTDAILAATTSGGRATRLSARKVDTIAEQLSIEFVARPEDHSYCQLRIRFGPYELTCDLTIET